MGLLVSLNSVGLPFATEYEEAEEPVIPSVIIQLQSRSKVIQLSARTKIIALQDRSKIIKLGER